MKEIISICPYCAHGCQLKFLVEKNKLKKVLPLKSDPVSLGHPCIKGLTLDEVVEKGRILKPMIRKGNKLVEVTWREAINKIVKKLKELAPEEVFFGTSGKITNEDNYIIQKFARSIIKTNNIDNCCSRLCHMPTVIGFKDCLGISASPGCLNDIKKLDCLLIIGSNPASNHPIAFQRIMEMKNKGGKIINVGLGSSDTARSSADISISICPGTEGAFLNGIINEIIRKKKYTLEAKKIKNFGELAKIVKPYSLERISRICQTNKQILNRAIKLISQSFKFGVMHGMGLTQHVNGVENIHSLVNLALLLNGKIVTGRGEVNVQGGGDMLGNPLPLQFSEAVNLKKLEQTWQTDLPANKEMNLIEAIALARAKMIFISAFNPAHSMPALDKIHQNLRQSFLVQIESYFNLTSKFAQVILPSPILFERTGTITNGERRIRLVQQALLPEKQRLPEWKIYQRLAIALGEKEKLNYKNEKEISKEIKKIVINYQKIDINKLYQGKDQFVLKKIKFKKFVPEKFEGSDEIKSKKYPFILFTFRSQFSFLTDEMTGKSKTLNKLIKNDKESLFFNPKDAQQLKITDNDKVLVTSSEASIKGLVKISSKIPTGFIGAHFHSEKLLINRLFQLQFDEETFIPNFKVAAVKISKINNASK